MIDGAGGNAALTINAASNYAYLNFAQAGSTKFEIGAEGATTNKGSLYFNHNIQVGSNGAALYIKKSNGYVGILNTDPQVPLHVTGAGTFTGNINAANFSGTSSGTNTGDQTNISGNAGTATTFSTTRTNYKGVTDGAVAGQLMWKNYGNLHTLFDASAATSPSGGAISRHTPDYPVGVADGGNSWGVNINLMGWNGSNTYGVKVDWSRYSESAGLATQVVTIQDSAPSAANGKLWWESDTGRLKVYYSTASAWVDTQPMPDMTLYYPKAGGTINGDVSIQLTLNVVGNALFQGNINAFGDIVAYSSSDIKLKDNFRIIESPLEKISKINGVSFNWNDKQSVYEAGKKDYGVIAQEVEEVLPELVITRENGYKAVRYEKIVSLLIETTKAQQAQIETLNNQVNKLTEKLNNL